MNTWIFQGNPKRFNVDDYVLGNEIIWWSIRQESLVKHVQINDEVFIWRSDGGSKGTGGIIARAVVITLPEIYKNDGEPAAHLYEELGDKLKQAVKLKVLEVDVKKGINRMELINHTKLNDLKILRLKQNTNYLVEEKHKSYLKQMWYNRYPVNAANVSTRFPLVKSLDQVKENMKQFEKDLTEMEELEKELKSFQQWYYLHNEGLLAPSKFIGYQEMKGHIYVDKYAIAGLDGRVTEKELGKLGFITTNNELLKKFVQQKLNGRVRKDFSVNILKSEREQIEISFSQSFIDNKVNNEDAHVLPPLDSSSRVGEYSHYPNEMKDIENLRELYEKVKSDIESQEVEEGARLEGKKVSYHMYKYERNSENRMKAIEIHGLNCCACGFNFEEVYGERGEGFIEIHHIKPLSTLEEAIVIDPETDLVPLCANCHRMVHRRKDKVLTIEELKALLSK
ncbi:TPA: EVE domain-containing protein [Bacillus anthracis]|nr:EVE domain-containing protein [Bacillus anthracis]